MLKSTARRRTAKRPTARKARYKTMRPWARPAAVEGRPPFSRQTTQGIGGSCLRLHLLPHMCPMMGHSTTYPV